MVLGPADEFVLIGTEHLKLSLPAGWQARMVERTSLPSQQRGFPTISASPVARSQLHRHSAADATSNRALHGSAPEELTGDEPK
jgi:hypothetical protein